MADFSWNSFSQRCTICHQYIGSRSRTNLYGLMMAIVIGIFVITEIPRVQAAKDGGDSEFSVELMTWGKDTIIHRGRKDIHLSHYSPQNAVAVLIVNDIPWTQPALRNQSGGFTVHAPPGHGLMAVVQVLNLRSDPMESSCIDFLRFYDPRAALGSPNICGKLSKENKKFMPNDVIGPRMFHSPGGIIQIQYKSDKGSDFDEESRVSATDGSELSFHMVEIVFTAYQDCDKDDMDPTVLSNCGDKCISSLVICDERINCGFEDDFAVDENSCDGLKDENLGSSPYLVNLYLGAGLFLVILLCTTALYHQQQAYKRIRNIPTK